MQKIVRQAVLLRDQYKCRKCERVLKHGLQLHHVMPQRLNGPDQPFNLVCLCQKCHRKWHDHERKLNIEWNPEASVVEFYRWLREPDADEVYQHLKHCQCFQEEEINALLSDSDLNRKPAKKKKQRFNNMINRR